MPHHAIKIHQWHHQHPNMRDRHHTIIGIFDKIFILCTQIFFFYYFAVVIAQLQVKLNKYSKKKQHFSSPINASSSHKTNTHTHKIEAIEWEIDEEENHTMIWYEMCILYRKLHWTEINYFCKDAEKETKKNVWKYSKKKTKILC